MQSVFSRDAPEYAVTRFPTVIHQEYEVRDRNRFAQILEASWKSLQDQCVWHIVSTAVYAVHNSRDAQLRIIEPYVYHADSKPESSSGPQQPKLKSLRIGKYGLKADGRALMQV